ncbi:small acid-soluble spore protein Tlp [Paenibacillus sp. y28]|uniref:small acid-soluble spore protein Tlp n=1 Tax=Paenibacillus sp. y28 TaxID=3129110 RepID=UPI00301625EA
MAKPDNRADNVAKLKDSIDNTLANLNEAKDYLDEHADEISSQELSAIQDKNARRKESIEGFRSEIADEAQAQQDAD